MPSRSRARRSASCGVVHHLPEHGPARTPVASRSPDRGERSGCGYLLRADLASPVVRRAGTRAVPACHNRAHAPRRPLRRPGRQPRRLLPDLVRVRRAGARAASRASARPVPPGMTAEELGRRTGDRAPTLVGRWAWGADAHDLVEIADGRLFVPDDVARRPARRGPVGVPGRPVPPRGDRRASTTATLPDVFRTGRPMPARPGPLPRGDRAADRPGHRGVLPGGAGGAAAAGRGPAARHPDPRRPLRRRPLAHRDGAPVPGHRR